MPRLEYAAETSAPPERVIAAARDFSERRPELWPNVAPEIYEVHEVGDGFAEVTEGTRFMGRVWERVRYEWPDPNVIRGTVQESNIFKPGSVWEMTVKPHDGGSRVEILNHKHPRGFRGGVIGVLFRLAGERALRGHLKRMLSAVEGEMARARQTES